MTECDGFLSVSSPTFSSIHESGAIYNQNVHTIHTCWNYCLVGWKKRTIMHDVAKNFCKKTAEKSVISTRNRIKYFPNKIRNKDSFSYRLYTHLHLWHFASNPCLNIFNRHIFRKWRWAKNIKISFSWLTKKVLIDDDGSSKSSKQIAKLIIKAKTCHFC